MIFVFFNLHSPYTPQTLHQLWFGPWLPPAHALHSTLWSLAHHPPMKWNNTAFNVWHKSLRSCTHKTKTAQIMLPQLIGSFRDSNIKILNVLNHFLHYNKTELVVTWTVWWRFIGMTFFMQSLIICEVKKLVSPLLSTVIFLKSSSKIGQMALVGWVM